MTNEPFHIKENSWLARIAAFKLKSASVAMVIGKTIHLHGLNKVDLLNNDRLLKHELCHIRQYKQHGTIGFLVKYMWESIRKGYYNNRFEVEARATETKTI